MLEIKKKSYIFLFWGISAISQYGKCLSLKKKIRILPVLKLSLSFNQEYIKIDLKNLQEPNWDKVTKEQKLDITIINYQHYNYCCPTYLMNYLCDIMSQSSKPLILGALVLPFCRYTVCIFYRFNQLVRLVMRVLLM